MSFAFWSDNLKSIEDFMKNTYTVALPSLHRVCGLSLLFLLAFILEVPQCTHSDSTKLPAAHSAPASSSVELAFDTHALMECHLLELTGILKPSTHVSDCRLWVLGNLPEIKAMKATVTKSTVTWALMLKESQIWAVYIFRFKSKGTYTGHSWCYFSQSTGAGAGVLLLLNFF